jgi:AraC family transcriptional regulator
MKTATLNDYKKRIGCVLEHIEQNLDAPMRLEKLAAVACFSPYHFHRIFRGMVGESVKEYVRRLRLERAAAQLSRGAVPVIDVALEAGYDSHAAFTRSFKAAFGIAPSACRGLWQIESSSGVHYGGAAGRSFRSRRQGGKMKVEIKQMEPMRVACLRHVGPYDEVGETWDRLLTQMGKEGYLGGNPAMLGICHDDPETTPAEKIRYDACLTVDEGFMGLGPIGVQTVAGGSYAVMTHKGPYNRLGESYSRLMGQWLPRSGRELRDAPAFEIYLNDPQTTQPGDLLTDICAPLQELRRGEEEK